MLGRPGKARQGRAVAGTAILLLLALLSNRFSDLDLWLSHRFVDAAGHGFSWRDSWLTAGLLHESARRLSMGVAAVLALGWLASWLPSQRARLQAWRAPVAFMLVSALASAWAVAALKHASPHSCPWDLQGFGGTHQFFRLFTPVPHDAGPGQCLPSGHASIGFMWVGALFAAARWPAALPWLHRRGVQLAWLAFSVTTSLAQVVRGAHFLSHVLIAVAVCWAVAAMIDLACDLMLSRRTGRVLPAATPWRAATAVPAATAPNTVSGAPL